MQVYPQKTVKTAAGKDFSFQQIVIEDSASGEYPSEFLGNVILGDINTLKEGDVIEFSLQSRVTRMKDGRAFGNLTFKDITIIKDNLEMQKQISTTPQFDEDDDLPI